MSGANKIGRPFKCTNFPPFIGLSVFPVTFSALNVTMHLTDSPQNNNHLRLNISDAHELVEPVPDVISGILWSQFIKYF